MKMKVHEHRSVAFCNWCNAGEPHSIGLCPRCGQVAHDKVTCQVCLKRQEGRAKERFAREKITLETIMQEYHSALTDDGGVP